MASAPATLAVEDSPQTANRDRRRNRRRDNRCLAISAASAPPPCKTSYCCGVRDGRLVLTTAHCPWKGQSIMNRALTVQPANGLDRPAQASNRLTDEQVIQLWLRGK